MNSEPKPLTERQFDVLGDLEAAIRVSPGAHMTCLLIGGQDGSHHSATLASLCRRGFATRKKWSMFCGCRCGQDAQFGHRCKGHFTYDITETGRQYLKAGKQ